MIEAVIINDFLENSCFTYCIDLLHCI